MNAPLRHSRLSLGNWTQIGLDALTDPNVTDMTMEAVCAVAGKTRGSFYAHFTGMDEFLAAVAEAWESEFTDRLIAETAGALPSRERLDRLNHLAMRLDHGKEQAIRRIAARNAGVARVVHRVDAKRIAYLAGLYRRSGRYSSEDAHALARIEYAAFVGMQSTEQDASAADRRQLYRFFLKITGRAS